MPNPFKTPSHLRIGLFSSWYDSILSKIFLKVEPQVFALSLEQQTERLRERHPARFKRFIINGTQHTALLADPTGIVGTDLGAVELPPDVLMSLFGGDLILGGLSSTSIDVLTIAEWLSAFIENDPIIWRDMVEERAPLEAE